MKSKSFLHRVFVKPIQWGIFSPGDNPIPALVSLLMLPLLANTTVLAIFFSIPNLFFGLAGYILTADWKSTNALVVSVESRRNHVRPTYTYDIDGVKYENDLLFYYPIVGFDHVYASSMDTYPTSGKEINIYYNPNKPEQSVILREGYLLSASHTYLLFFLSIATLGYCFLHCSMNKYEKERGIWSKEPL